LDSPKETTIYDLKDTKTGEHLKYGITSEIPIENRYSQKFLSGKEMQPINRGTRKAMAKMERRLVEKNPGPLNKKPWAGTRMEQ